MSTTGVAHCAAPVISRRWPSWPSEFDVVVLGGGPGGYAAALYGAAAGLDIAMVEDGGSAAPACTAGCIPAKELLQTAEVLRTVQRRAPSSASHVGEPTLDLGRAAGPQAAGRRPADQGPRDAAEGPQGHGRSRARRASPTPPAHRVRVSDGTEVAGAQPGDRDRLVARARCPASTSTARASCRPTTCSSSTELPARVAVIGGGAIGCEFASILVDIGSEVTILEALPQILAGVDQQVAGNVVARSFKKRGIKVQHRRAASPGIDGATRAHRLVGDRRGRRSRSSSTGRRERRPRAAQRAASGSRPRASRSTSAASSSVDGNMRTNVDGVYAVGDVVATPQLAHVGVRRGDRRDQDDPRRGRRRRSTTTRCRGASTATPRSRSAGSPRSRRSERGLRRRRRRCTASAATAAR